MSTPLSNPAFSNPAFSVAEHEHRLAQGRQVLAAHGLGACVCSSPELIYYFTGYDAHTHHAIGSQALILTADDHPPRLLMRNGDIPQADETMTVGETRPYRYGSVDLATLVLRNLQELQCGDAMIGIDSAGYTMNGALTLRLCALLGEARVSDITRLMGRQRVVLSPAEIAYVQKAARHAKAGLAAFERSVSAGMTEIELAAEIEYAMRRSGSDYPAVPTWLSSGNRSHCQHGMATDRLITQGDVVHSEFAGVSRRYQCVTMATAVVGEPSARVIELAEGAKASYRAGLAQARIGAPIGLMEQAYLDELTARGLGDTFIMRFGVGTSAAYPPAWENQISIQLESTDLLMEGMVFYIHPSMQDLPARLGMLFGDSFLMTSDGPVALTDAPIDLILKS